MEHVSGLIFGTLFLQSLRATTHNSIDSNIPAPISVEKNVSKMATCGFCPLDDFSHSPNLQHSTGHSTTTESASSEPEHNLPPNTTRKKELEKDEFFFGKEKRVRDAELKLGGPVESSFEHKVQFSTRKWGNGQDFYSKSTSFNAFLKDRLSVGIAIRSSFNQSVELERSLFHKTINQFTIDIFETAVKLLPYRLSYGKVPFYGSHTDLLKEVALKSIDAAVGDIIISAKGYKFVEFSQPFLEVKLVMVVSTAADKLQTWLFLRLFTPWMWFLLAGTSFFTGFVIWLVEHQNHNDSGGSLSSTAASDSPASRITVACSFAFATLYYGQRERPNCSMSHLVLAPWLLLMLVVSATFTSSFTSMVTNSHTEPSKTDINELRRRNAAIGCDGNSLSIKYLVRVSGFKAKNIRNIASIDDYKENLSSGNVEVAFMLMPYAKVFLAKYCTGSFAIAGPAYDLGGFGFAFPKGSSLALDMSEAIVRLRERGDLQILEEEMLSSIKCSASSPSATNARQSLGPEPFVGFFIISGGASTIALVITVIRLLGQHWYKLTNIQTTLIGRGFWIWLATLFAQNQTRNELQLARRSSMHESEG